MNKQFILKTFYELTLDELYAIMRLRQEVFTVEQDCPYQDCDDKDQESMHLLFIDHNNSLLAYTRILPKGLSYQEYSSIGRVVNSKSVRGQGIGHLIMKKSIAIINEKYGNVAIKISAQTHLSAFYEAHGFHIAGSGYLEDNIPHVAMVLPAST